MHGRNLMPLVLAVSLALGGGARADPQPTPRDESSAAEARYRRGLLAALRDADDEVVAWTLLTLASDVDAVPEVREGLQDFLRTPRAAQALRVRRGRLWMAVLVVRGQLTPWGSVDGSPADTVRGLVDALKVEEDPDLREAVEQALEKMGPALGQQASLLIELLKDPEWQVNASAQRVLEHLGASNPELVSRLGELLKEPDWNVRWRAAQLLGNLGPAARGQLPRLEELRRDPDENVRQAANEAVGALGGAGAQPPRASPPPDDSPPPQSLEALARAQDAASQKLFQRFQGDALLPPAEASARQAERLKNPDATVRETALTLLALQGENARPQAPRIAELLNDRDRRVRGAAAMALGDVGATEQASRLAELLEDPDAFVRGRAAEALGKLGARQYASRLIALLGTRDAADPLLSRLGQSSFDDASAPWRALIAMTPLEPQDVALLAAMMGNRPPAERPLWLARAHGLGGGEHEAEQLLPWLGGRPPSQLPHGKSLPPEAARATLEAFARLWPYARRFPVLEEELSRRIEQVALQGRGRWREEDRPLLEGHEKNLLAAQRPQQASGVREALESISSTSRVPRTVAWALAAHAGFWLLLLFVYPRSPRVQAVFFWNPWVRRLLGLGYVGVLLTWVPFLRRRLLAPFQRLLIADANVGRFIPERYPERYFDRAEVCVEATKQRMPLLQALPHLKGLVVLEGASGLGKSMFIRYLLKRTKALSVYLPAGRCKEGVLEAIQAKLEGHARDTGFLQSIIYSGALDIYIDGLNEVAADTRARIVQFVESKLHGNILLATQHMERPPALAELYELLPLTEAQVREFLLGREPLPEEEATKRGEAYREACEKFLSGALSDGQPRALRESMLEVLSNPMDLTVVAQLLASGVEPNLARPQQGQYELMAQKYEREYREPFPEMKLAEVAYQMKREERWDIPEKGLGKALRWMEAFKMVVLQEWGGPEGTAGHEWHFRHDKLQDFFIAWMFMTKGFQQFDEHMDEARFRGVYLQLASLLELEQAVELKERVGARADQTHEHTLRDEVVPLVDARLRAESTQSPSPPPPPEEPGVGAAAP